MVQANVHAQGAAIYFRVIPNLSDFFACLIKGSFLHCLSILCSPAFTEFTLLFSPPITGFVVPNVRWAWILLVKYWICRALKMLSEKSSDYCIWREEKQHWQQGESDATQWKNIFGISTVSAVTGGDIDIFQSKLCISGDCLYKHYASCSLT